MRKISFQADIDGGKAAKQLDQLKKKILRTEEALNKAGDTRDSIAERMEKATNAAEKTRAKVKQLQADLQKANEAVENSKIGFTRTPETDVQEAKRDRINRQLIEQQKLLKSQTAEAEREYKAYSRSEEKVAQITKDLERQQSAAGKLEEKLSKAFVPERLREAGQQIKTSMNSMIKNALKWGLGLRSVYVAFRALRTAAIEGVKEMAKYDANTNKALSNIKNAATGFKASVASAFAQILQIIEPIITRILNLITTVINYIGMLLAALRGQSTYKKAIAAQTDYASALEATGKAAKQASGYLSGLDEVQRFNDGKSDSGASGGAAGSIVDGMEEVQIPSNLKKFTGWITDHLEEIKTAALGVGAAFLGWKIASAFTDDLTKIVGIAGGLAGATFYVRGFMDAWKNGIDWKNLTTMLIGTAIAAVALGLAFGGIAAGVTLLIAGIGLLILYLHENWDEIKEWAREKKEKIDKFFDKLGEKISTWYEEKVRPWFTRERWERLANDAITALKNKFQPKIDAIREWYTNKVAPWFTVARWRQLGTDALTNLKTALQGLSWWNPVSEWFNSKVKPWFTLDKWKQLGTDAINGIKNGLSQMQIPKFHLTWGYEYKGFNVLGNYVGMNIPWPQLSFYARGGIVDGATWIAPDKIAGEDGAEAIIPLERHTEWIDKVAARLADKLEDRLTAIFLRTPLPAVATGSLIPPRISVDLPGLEELTSEFRALSEALTRQRGGDYRFIAQINRRTIFDEMIEEAKLRQQSTGRNPFDMR